MSSTCNTDPIFPAREKMERLIRETILKVEEELLNIEIDEDRLKMRKIPSRNPSRSSFKPAPFTGYRKAEKSQLSSDTDMSVTSAASTVKDKSEKQTSLRLDKMVNGSKAKVVPKSIEVSHLTDGCVIDLIVKVKRASSVRLLELTIECPQFYPKRIRFDGKWHDIVDGDKE